MEVGTPADLGTGGIDINPWIDTRSVPSAPWSTEDVELLTSYGVPLSVALALEGQLGQEVQHQLVSMLHALVLKSRVARDQLNAHQRGGCYSCCASLGSRPGKEAACLAADIGRLCKERHAEAGQQVACEDWTRFGSACEVWLRRGQRTIRVLVQSEADNHAAAFDFDGVHLTGGRVWAGSLLLSRWLASLHFAQDLRSEGRGAGLAAGPVLEVGAGLGLAGIVLAKLGRKVVLSDREPVLLDRLQENIGTNGVGENCRVLALDWAMAGRVKMRRLLQAQRFSAVIGADVIYCEPSADLMVRMLPHALPSGGVAYFVNARRHRSGILGFADKLRSAGHQVHEQHAACDQALQDLVCGSFEPEQEYVALTVLVAAP